MKRVLYRKNPAMFRNHPFRFMLFLLFVIPWKLYPLSFVSSLDFPTLHEFLPSEFFPWGIGLIPLALWWVWNKRITLVITSESTVLRRGLLAKHTNEVLHTSVRNIHINQSIINRIFGVGQISIASAGSAEIEIIVRGMPSPAKVRKLINDNRRVYTTD